MAFFSILLPTFNRQHLISRAIESVLEQGFEDWELLVVDDGSTDRTDEVMKKFLSDKRIKYFKKENSGAAHSRNIGATEAQGKYFTFLDSDDTFEPHKLDVNFRYIKNFGDEKCFYSGFRRIDSKSGTVLEEIKGKATGNMEEELKNHNPIHALGTVVIPREIFKSVDGFDPEFRARQDVDLYYRISKVAEFVAIPDILTNIYVNSADRITSNYYNRLSGFQLYLEKHGKDMNFSQKSYLAKRLFVYALRNKSYTVALKNLPLSLWSFGSKILRK